MKKKFAGLLAASLAMVLTLGMTVSAAPSVSTEHPGVSNETLEEDAAIVEAAVKSQGFNVEGMASDTLTVTVNKISVETYDDAVVKGIDLVWGLDSDTTKATVLWAFDLNVVVSATGDSLKDATITIPVPGVETGKDYVLLHEVSKGVWEAIPATVSENGKLTATFKTLSPIVVVEVEKDVDDDDDDDNNTLDGAPASPKTGETLPVAGVMTLICLAGAAVCAKKVRRI